MVGERVRQAYGRESVWEGRGKPSPYLTNRKFIGNMQDVGVGLVLALLA